MNANAKLQRGICRLTVAALLAAVALAAGAAVAGGECAVCRHTAELMKQNGFQEARADHWLARAKAQSLEDAEERREAVLEAREEFREQVGEVREQYAARVDLCEVLEEGRYAPEIDPDDFLTPEETAADPNPYLPLVPGTTYRYEGETEDGIEGIEVEITDETREILGVACIVVRDTVTVDGELVEDTRDWFAQDAEGNVWYFGELSVNYEDGELADIEGSWEAGEDGAFAGIVMPAAPEVGMAYRQEYLLGEAEDAAEVLSLDESAAVPYGAFDACLMTGDFTPLEPDAYEYKFYAPGLGLVLEVDAETGERVELVAVEID
jgi:hypothetical protein